MWLNLRIVVSPAPAAATAAAAAAATAATAAAAAAAFDREGSEMLHMWDQVPSHLLHLKQMI